MWDVSSLYDCADLTKYDFSDNLGKYILSSVGPKRHIEGVLAIDDKCIIPESLPINIDDFFNNAKSSNKWLEPHLLIILMSLLLFKRWNRFESSFDPKTNILEIPSFNKISQHLLKLIKSQ